jgi:hypothetical protein
MSASWRVTRPRATRPERGANRAVADLKVWRVLFADYRRPLDTFETTFQAATGLYFFKAGFA